MPEESKKIQASDDWGSFTLAILVLIGVLFLYYCNFGFNGRISNRNEDWGLFADFVGGLMNPVLSIIVLWTLIKTLRLNSDAVRHSSNAVEEARLSREAEESRIKRQNTFDFSQTFQSREMMQSRLLASKLLYRNIGKSYNLGTMKHLDDYIHLAMVINSFAQLNVLKRNNLIDENLSKELFGSYYISFKMFFDVIEQENKENLPDNLVAKIKELRSWMPKDQFD